MTRKKKRQFPFARSPRAPDYSHPLSANDPKPDAWHQKGRMCTTCKEMPALEIRRNKGQRRGTGVLLCPDCAEKFDAQALERTQARRNSSMRLLIEAISRDMSHDSENLLRYLRIIDWDSRTEPFDWRNRIPQTLRDNWGRLSLDARLSLFLLARSNAHDRRERAEGSSDV